MRVHSINEFGWLLMKCGRLVIGFLSHILQDKKKRVENFFYLMKNLPVAHTSL